MRLSEITDYLDSKKIEYDYIGKKELIIDHISSLQDIDNNSICWIKTKKYYSDDVIFQLMNKKDVLIVSPFSIEEANCIVTSYPKGVYFGILNHFFSSSFQHNISEKAVVLTNQIGKNVHIGANCFIGENVIIGDNTIIHPNVSIICPCSIGHDCELFPGVVIGADGFGYYYEGDIPYREQHFMGVKIGNCVDIGANTCIDRGLITDTIVKDHVKIDNLCHIGHNVIIEDNCLVIAGSIICGSAVIGENAYLSPGATVLNQVKVGKGAKVGSNSLAISNVKDSSTIFGVPGRRISGK